MIAKVTFASSKRLIGKRFRIKRREREEGSRDFGGDRSSFTSSASPPREIGCRSSRRVSPTKSEREEEGTAAPLQGLLDDCAFVSPRDTYVEAEEDNCPEVERAHCAKCRSECFLA